MSTKKSKKMIKKIINFLQTGGQNSELNESQII
jgi:hypothetical protein